MKKEFDTVKMMRDIRAKLHAEYEKNPALRKKRLARIHKKYGIRKKYKTSDDSSSIAAEPRAKYRKSK